MSTPRTRPITPSEAEHNIKRATGWHKLMSDYVTEQSLIDMYARNVRQNDRDRDWQRLHFNAVNRQSRIAAKLFEIELAHKCADCGEWFGTAAMHPIDWAHDIMTWSNGTQSRVTKHRTAQQRCDWCHDIATSATANSGEKGTNNE